MAMPRKPRKSSALVGTWVAASAGAAWSIVSSSPSPSRGDDRPDDDQAGARKHRERRRFGEEHEAEDRRPDQRRIVEGGQRRRLGPGIGARHEIMPPTPSTATSAKRARSSRPGARQTAAAKGERMSAGPIFWKKTMYTIGSRCARARSSTSPSA